MSQSAAPTQPSTSPKEQSDGSREPARGQKRHAPSWSGAEILDLIEVWGNKTNLQDLTRDRNTNVYGQMSKSLANKGHIRTQEQVRMKVEELCQAYARARERSSHSQAESHTCPYYKDLACTWGVGQSLPPHPG